MAEIVERYCWRCHRSTPHQVIRVGVFGVKAWVCLACGRRAD